MQHEQNSPELLTLNDWLGSDVIATVNIWTGTHLRNILAARGVLEHVPPSEGLEGDAAHRDEIVALYRVGEVELDLSGLRATARVIVSPIIEFELDERTMLWITLPTQTLN